MDERGKRALNRLEGKAAAQRHLHRPEELPLRNTQRICRGKLTGLQGPRQAGGGSARKVRGVVVGSENGQVSSAPLKQQGLNTQLAAQAPEDGTAHSQGCPNRSVPGMRDGDTPEARQRRAAQSAPAFAANDAEGKTEGLLSSEKRRQRTHLIAVFHNLNVGHRAVTWDTSNRTKASGGQLQEDKVWLNMGRIRVNRQPSSIGTGTHEGCEPSSLEALEIQLCRALSYLI